MINLSTSPTHATVAPPSFGTHTHATHHSTHPRHPTSTRLSALCLGGGVLAVLLEDAEGLVDAGLEGRGVVHEVEELGGLHLEEHAGDLAGELLASDGLDAREEELAEVLAAVRRREGGEVAHVDGRVRHHHAGHLAGVAGVVVELAAGAAARAGGAGRVGAALGARGAATATAAAAATLAGAARAAGRHAGHRHRHHAGHGRALRRPARAAARRHLGRVAHGVAGHLAVEVDGDAHVELLAVLHAVGALGADEGGAVLLALGQSHVEGLDGDNLAVHLRDGLGGLLRGGEADKAKAAGDALGVAHDLGAGDVAKLGKGLAQGLVVDGLVQVLDVEVDALGLGVELAAARHVLRLEQLLALRLLLRAAGVDDVAANLLVVEGLDGGGSSLGRLKVDKAKAAAVVGLVAHDDVRGDGAVRLAERLEAGVVHRGRQVLQEDVGELQSLGAERRLAVALAHKLGRKDLLALNHLAVDHLNGLVRIGVVHKVHKAEPLALAALVGDDLAREDLAKVDKGVVEGLAVDVLLEVLDEDVAVAGAAQGGVAVRPHDAHRAALERLKVELLEGAAGLVVGVEVDVGVAEGAAGDGVAADADRGDGANSGVEALEEHGLVDVRVQVADVERDQRGGGVRGHAERQARRRASTGRRRRGHRGSRGRALVAELRVLLLHVHVAYHRV
eukprot:m.155780 g.155780  ORF g.155780 m.155780 type:complete len:676 (+) comp16970_c2_seq3:460-2487(+)